MGVNLAEYFTLLSQRLRTDLQAARMFVSATDKGGISEYAFRHFLNPLLPTQYAVGIGEVIVPDIEETRRIAHSEQKDVIIYDPSTSAIFGWGDSGISLFPIESVYAVIEVKTCFHNTNDVKKAARQAFEIKQLQKEFATQVELPLTAIFAFTSEISKESVFTAIQELDVDERPDITLFLGNVERNGIENSVYITHWHYVDNGNGAIGFVTAREAADVRDGIDSGNRKVFLTLAESENALLWFYLFLVARLQIMDNQIGKPRYTNLWRYASSSTIDLGHVKNEPFLPPKK